MKTELAAPRAMLGAREAAAMCGIGRSLFLTLVDTGRAPLPLKLGRRTLWRVKDLQDWIDAGCPARVEV
jgi:predicted DNA-binding transcriptional regulator AlpA